MNDERKLAKLEKDWESHFNQFTVPEPSREKTLDLIQKIKQMEQEQRPVDLRKELEMSQHSLSTSSKIRNMFLSQWNFYGTASWLLTGLLMIIITFSISENTNDTTLGFTSWIKWITLLVITVVSYSFRPKNEGNEIIETLSYYPIIQQIFIRFLIVMGFQIILALPLSFIVIGKESTMLYIVSSFIPVFFFGVMSFVAIFWLGQKLGLALTLLIWFSQIVVKKKILFQLPNDDYFFIMNLLVFGVSILILSSVFLKKNYMVNVK